MNTLRRLVPALLATFLLVIVFPADTTARPEFARLTGQACGHCHVSPLGGGSLSPDGLAFKENLDELGIPTNPALRLSTGQKLLHIFLWLVHIPFGVAWLVLFVLAFLPSLKAGGMAVPPRSYTIRMIVCVAVVAITGPTIVYLKSLGTQGLFSTRFGMLLLVKMAAVLALLAATVVLLWHTTVLLSRRYRKLASLLGREGELDLAAQDLRLFDGSERRRALVAMDGKLYDVTGRDLWRKGIHPGGHRAGGDLTRALLRAPHGKEVFERISPVGNLLERPPRTHTGPRWAFLLGIAASVVILTIVVLWRW